MSVSFEDLGGGRGKHQQQRQNLSYCTSLIAMNDPSTKVRTEGKPTHLNTLPPLLPVPQLNRHIITPRQDQALRRMHSQASNIVRMRFNSSNLLPGVVVEDAEVKIVGAADKPVSARDETYATNGYFRHFEGFDDRLEEYRRGDVSFVRGGEGRGQGTDPGVDVVDYYVPGVETNAVITREARQF